MLDKNDKIIFEHLLHDCRTSIRYLSKVTRLTEPAVLQRIEKLETNKYISKYDAILDYNKIFSKTQLIFVRVNDDNIDLFEKQMVANKKIATVYRLINKYNYFLLANFENISKIENDLKELSVDYTVHELKSMDFFSFSIYDIPVKYKPKETLKKIVTKKSVKIDQTDKKIIKHLIDGGGRDSLLEISRKLDISYDVVIYRFKKLKKEGFFPLFLAQPGVEKFSIQTDMIILKTSNLTQDSVARKIQSTQKCPYLMQFDENTYFTQIFSQSFDEFKLILEQIWKSFGQNLVDVKVYNTKDWLILNRHDFW